jgi:hypothetical protein
MHISIHQNRISVLIYEYDQKDFLCHEQNIY